MSPRIPRLRSTRAALAFAAAALATLPAWPQAQPTLLAPESPKSGASVGKKPRFVVRAEGGDAEKLRFRIELSKDDFRTIDYTFDQLKDANGWAYTALPGDVPAALFVTPKPLPGGEYDWRVASWDGLSWLESPTKFHVTVDDVPPADVEGLRLNRDIKKGCVVLDWARVTNDVNGAPERVGLYHVYRYTAPSALLPIRPMQAGETDDTRYEDCDRAALKKPILFYKVVAEDEAGNIPGRRY